MAKALTAQADVLLSTAEVRAVLGRASAALADFAASWPVDFRWGWKLGKAAPPSLDGAPWEAVVLLLNVSGRLDARAMSPAVVAGMVGDAQEALGAGGKFEALCWRDKPVPARLVEEYVGHGWALVEVSGGVPRDGYYPGSLPRPGKLSQPGIDWKQYEQDDLAHQQAVIAQASRAAPLPLEVEPRARGFTLRHTEGHPWHVCIGLGSTPVGFTCEVPGLGPAELARLYTLLTFRDSPFGWRWTLDLRLDEAVPAEGRLRLYETLRSGRWPIKAGSIRGIWRLLSPAGLDLAGRLLAGEKKPQPVAVATAKWRTDGAGAAGVELLVSPGPDGHRLSVRLRGADAAALPALSGLLGVPLLG